MPCSIFPAIGWKEKVIGWASLNGPMPLAPHPISSVCFLVKFEMPCSWRSEASGSLSDFSNSV